MVLGYHAIISAYGFWLPNDPRGSWSDFVGAWELLRFGTATKTDERRSLAARPHDHGRRLEAKRALKYPPVTFNGIQARAIARGFGTFAQKSGMTVWACAVLRDHTHLIIARHTYPIEQAVNLLKGAATRRLVAEDVHPLAASARGQTRPHTPWARGLWKVFLNSDAHIRRAIRYVEDNPLKEGQRRQNWSFVRPYAGTEIRRQSLRSPLARG